MSTNATNKPLIDRLGFRPGETVLVIDAPDWYDDFAIRSGFSIVRRLPATHAHVFCSSSSQLSAFMAGFTFDQLTSSLWLSWPKKSSGARTDITEQALRDTVLPLGWVDVKVANIDDTWSGLKFLRRRR